MELRLGELLHGSIRKTVWHKASSTSVLPKHKTQKRQHALNEYQNSKLFYCDKPVRGIPTTTAFFLLKAFYFAFVGFFNALPAPCGAHV